MNLQSNQTSFPINSLNYTCTVDVTSNWIERLCLELGAGVEFCDATGGYKIMKCTPNPDLGEGEYCFLQLNESMAALYADVEYNVPLRINFDNRDGEYIILCFSFEEQVKFINEGNTSLDSKISDQIILMDCSLQSNFGIEPGLDSTKTPKCHTFRIFIKREYAMSMASSLFNRETLLSISNPETNTVFVQLDMDLESKMILEKFALLKMSEPAYGFYLSGAAFSLITNFYENLRKKVTTEGHLHGSDILAVKKTMKIINSNLESQFPGIISLANSANMSNSKYKRVFSQVYGDSPKRVFLDRKVELGRELLLTGDYSVSEVVYRLGYSNTSFFASIFKRRFGILPRKILEKAGSVFFGLIGVFDGLIELEWFFLLT